MGITVRAIGDDEIPAFVRTDAAGFGESRDIAERMKEWIAFELDRTRCAFEGDAMVGCSRNYSLELTLPGGAQVGCAGVSAVAVLPTHRRRGVLRTLMAELLDEAVARGEPLAALTASEGGIYGRFGFGVSTRSLNISIDTRDAVFSAARPAGRLRMIDVDEARKLEPEIFERVRVDQPGAISRPDAWWADVQYQDPQVLGTRFDVVFEGASGSLEGFVCYGIKEQWAADGAHHQLAVRDFVATTPEAIHALWRYICEVDLVQTIRWYHLPLDSPLPWLLESARAVRTVGLDDYVWTRILDVPAALGARRYAADGRVTFEVTDAFRPDGAAAGTFVLEGGPDGAEVRPDEGGADLACDVAALSAGWLGGVRWSELASAGLVAEREPGALARADAMFASSPLPYPYTWF